MLCLCSRTTLCKCLPMFCCVFFLLHHQKYIQFVVNVERPKSFATNIIMCITVDRCVLVIAVYKFTHIYTYTQGLSSLLRAYYLCLHPQSTEETINPCCIYTHCCAAQISLAINARSPCRTRIVSVCVRVWLLLLLLLLYWSQKLSTNRSLFFI